MDLNVLALREELKPSAIPKYDITRNLINLKPIVVDMTDTRGPLLRDRFDGHSYHLSLIDSFGKVAAICRVTKVESINKSVLRRWLRRPICNIFPVLDITRLVVRKEWREIGLASVLISVALQLAHLMACREALAILQHGTLQHFKRAMKRGGFRWVDPLTLGSYEIPHVRDIPFLPSFRSYDLAGGSSIPVVMVKSEIDGDYKSNLDKVISRVRKNTSLEIKLPDLSSVFNCSSPTIIPPLVKKAKAGVGEIGI